MGAALSTVVRAPSLRERLTLILGSALPWGWVGRPSQIALPWHYPLGGGWVPEALFPGHYPGSRWGAEFGSAFVLCVLLINEKVGFRARAWAGGRGSCQCPRPSPGTPHPPRARALRRPAPCAMRHGGFMVLVDSPSAFFSNLLAESAASCREEMGRCFDAPWVLQHHHV